MSQGQKHASPEQAFVDALREVLGLAPLYAPEFAPKHKRGDKLREHWVAGHCEWVAK